MTISTAHRPVPAPAFFAVLAALLASACGGSEPDPPVESDTPAAQSATPGMGSAEAITISGVGFATPESVLHDTAADVYLVSNINGAPLDPDGNGFISRVAPTGEVLELKWIDGEEEGVTLSAPKGMAIVDQALFVSDIDCIRWFDVTTGAPVGEACVEGARFLNDLVADGAGGVVFSDLGRDATFAPTGADAIYRLDADGYATVLGPAERGGPNGLAMAGDDLIVVTYFGGEIFRLDPAGNRTDVLAVEGAQYDGVEVLDDGSLLVSDWGASCVHRVGPDGASTCMVGEVEGPADIGIDRDRDRVLIPLFMANEVWIRPIG